LKNEEVKKLRESFFYLDVDSDGKISVNDLKTSLKGKNWITLMKNT